MLAFMSGFKTDYSFLCTPHPFSPELNYMIFFTWYCGYLFAHLSPSLELSPCRAKTLILYIYPGTRSAWRKVSTQQMYVHQC